MTTAEPFDLEMNTDELISRKKTQKLADVGCFFQCERRIRVKIKAFMVVTIKIQHNSVSGLHSLMS